MERKFLYFIIGSLMVVVAGFSYYTYKCDQKPTGMSFIINKTNTFKKN